MSASTHIEKSHIDITVAICTFNRSRQLLEALESVIDQDTGNEFTYEILVVNNACTDSTQQDVERLSERCSIPIRIVKEPRPGLAKARNCGVEHAQGDWLVVFDDDQLATRHWLLSLWRVAQSTSADIVSGPRLLLEPENSSPDSLCVADLPRECHGILGLTDITSDTRQLRKNEYACDANIMRHRHVHSTLGPFDESMQQGGQDDRLSRRAVQEGFRVWYAADAIVHHRLTEKMLSLDYLRWKSHRGGVIRAQHDKFFGGTPRVVKIALGRAGQSLCLSMPKLLVALLRRDSKSQLVQQCQIWRTAGYWMQLLAMTTPQWISLRLLRRLEFRRGRREITNTAK